MLSFLKLSPVILALSGSVTLAQAAPQTPATPPMPHHDHGVQSQTVERTQSEDGKRIVIKKVRPIHDGEGMPADVADTAEDRCAGMTREVLVDSVAPAADGKSRKMKMILCSDQALTAADKVARLKQARARVATEDFGDEDGTKAAILADIDARIAEFEKAG